MKILCICHNTPYPPNKGDKIRPYHIIRHLAKAHEVHVVALSKHATDRQYEPALNEFCASSKVIPLNSMMSKICALLCVLSPFPLTFGFFFSWQLRKEVQRITEETNFDVILAFCSSSAQYVLSSCSPFRVVDFIDIDSEKWRQYARVSNFPKSFIYSLEAHRLRKWEGIIHQRVDLSILTTGVERHRLVDITPDRKNSVQVVPNGIDLAYFKREQPVSFERAIVFTGQMDYLPNIDAVVYFYVNILPLVLKKVPDAKFYIVGRNPAPELSAVCREAVITGEVEDIREHLHRAKVFVAPLRLAFGVQNKVLEAMASQIPVVATTKVVAGLSAVVGEDILVADAPAPFAEAVIQMLLDDERAGKVAANGYRYVRENHDWQTILADFEKALPLS